MLGRNSCLFICRAIALLVVVSCAPISKTRAAEPANARSAIKAPPPPSAPIKNPTYPTLENRRQATQLRMFSGQVLAIWNGQFLAEGQWAGTKPDFALNTSFATSGTVSVFINETGERIQWLRQDEAVEDGWIARDRLVFYDQKENKLGEWSAGESLSSVFFGDVTLAIKNKQLMKIHPNGVSSVVREDVGRATQILFANAGEYVLCRNRKVTESFAPTANATAGCESTKGWRFEGTWFADEPLVCDGKLVAFSNKHGSNQWNRMTVRDLSTGAIEAEVQDRGTQVTCIQDRVVEIATGRSWAARDGRRLPRLKCGGQKPKLWAAAKDVAICLDVTGNLHAVK